MLLSDRIAADLRHELASGKPWDHTCTLQALAARFGVSLTPVREATAQLVKSKHLIKQPNGRLIAAPNPPAAPAPMPPAADAGAAVRAEVIHCRLSAGAPVFLREEDFAQRFDIGRTVLRRLFFRMAGEGLLEHAPRRGWRANPFRDEDMESFVTVRELLEPKALKLAFPHLDLAFLQEVREGNQPARGSTPAKIDNRLHAHWIERCGNRHIAAFFAQNGGPYAALFDHAALDQATASAMACQHRDILDAVLAGDKQEACRQVVVHARSQLENARRLRQSLIGKKAASAAG